MRKVLLSYLLFFGGIVQGQSGQNLNTRALNFGVDGDRRGAYVSIPSPISGSFTIEFWVTSDISASGYAQWWAGFGIVDADLWGVKSDFGISLSDGSKIAFGLGELGGSDVTIKSTTSIYSNSTSRIWYHVAATWDKPTKAMKLYINGTQEATGTSSGSSNRTPATISLGKMGSDYSANSWSGGTLDELRIWNVVRTSNEILANYNKQIVGAKPGLIASYHFDQGVANACNSIDCGAASTINTLIDDSGNNRTGTLYLFSLNGSSNNWVTASVTLPVTWQSFTAEKQGDVSVLKWSTASEQNTKDFEVQHSTNTLSWTPLGTVAAAGNSTTTQQYSFTHATPFKGNMYNYYRIMQRDLDGKFSYSKIASLIYDEPGPDVYVYPNPAIGIVTIYLAESQDVRLIDIAGATVWKGTLAAGRSQIPLTHLSKGIYWVVTENAKKQLLIQ
ncbi:MAG: T9SS C-terminal target domain-containing protein [Chitinophagia bacterium]|nr:T9SS C-terminal target domain-containing protein [Chitinophagia bacterium]